RVMSEARSGRRAPLRMPRDAKCTKTKHGDQTRRAAQSWREQRWRPAEAPSPPEGSERRRAHREPTGQTHYRQQIRSGRQQRARLPRARAVHGANPLLLVQPPGASNSVITNSRAFQSPCASTCLGEASRVQAQPARGGWGHPGSGHDHTGGLAGSATGNLWNTAATCEVEGAEATGDVTKTSGLYVGGLVAVDDGNTSYASCYW